MIQPVLKDFRLVTRFRQTYIDPSLSSKITQILNSYNLDEIESAINNLKCMIEAHISDREAHPVDPSIFVNKLLDKLVTEWKASNPNLSNKTLEDYLKTITNFIDYTYFPSEEQLNQEELAKSIALPLLGLVYVFNYLHNKRFDVHTSVFQPLNELIESNIKPSLPNYINKSFFIIHPEYQNDFLTRLDPFSFDAKTKTRIELPKGVNIKYNYEIQSLNFKEQADLLFTYYDMLKQDNRVRLLTFSRINQTPIPENTSTIERCFYYDQLYHNTVFIIEKTPTYQSLTPPEPFTEDKRYIFGKIDFKTKLDLFFNNYNTLKEENITKLITYVTLDKMPVYKKDFPLGLDLMHNILILKFELQQQELNQDIFKHIICLCDANDEIYFSCFMRNNKLQVFVKDSPDPIFQTIEPITSLPYKFSLAVTLDDLSKVKINIKSNLSFTAITPIIINLNEDFPIASISRLYLGYPLKKLANIYKGNWIETIMIGNYDDNDLYEIMIGG